jgi:hypothetical protein
MESSSHINAQTSNREYTKHRREIWRVLLDPLLSMRLDLVSPASAHPDTLTSHMNVRILLYGISSVTWLEPETPSYPNIVNC